MMEIREIWSGLQPRDRKILSYGGVLVAIMLFYIVVWEPLGSTLQEQRDYVRILQNQHLWMQHAALEAKQLNKGQPITGRSGSSLLNLAGSSSKKYQLKDAVKRLQPEGDNNIRVWLEKASFDRMLGWLDNLSSQGVHVTSLVVERNVDVSGTVNARITLESRR